MSEKWEYKVAFVDRWERTSIEGEEQRPEQGERNSAFGRRFLNGMGADGWELTGIQPAQSGSAYFIFKRPLAEGAEPDMTIKRREQAEPSASQPSTPPASDGPIVTM